MKWRPGSRGGNIEDRRGQGGGLGGGGLGGLGGGGFPIPIGRGGGGIGTILILLLVYFVFIKGCGGGGGLGIPNGGTNAFPQVPQSGDGTSVSASPNEESEKKLVSQVDGDAEQFWQQQFQAAGKQYTPSTVVLFRGQTDSGCGTASSETGPFYCPLDQKVYLDLGFFDELDQRFKAPGDFAQAYVVAHELGHHVQKQLGIEPKVREESQRDPDKANELSVRLELQADCYAGVWGRSV